ncbi:MAG: hypothetical protein ACTSRC_21835 [Candidatus Helarchaeota archaeon]
MAWNEGTMSHTMGSLISVLDTYLVANDYWSVYDDSAGTATKVYRNYDPSANVDYYVKVQDNFSGYSYAKIELWEGWDSGSHTGTGQGLTQDSNDGNYLYIHKPSGGYGIAVGDHRFVFCDLANYQGYYVGQLSRIDTSKNMPILICSGYTSISRNPLGARNYCVNGGDAASWQCLFDENGTKRTIHSFCDYNMNNESYITESRLESKTISGTYLILETPIINHANKLVMGYLDGVMWKGQNESGLANGDIIQYNSVDWIALGGGDSWSLVRKS